MRKLLGFSGLIVFMFVLSSFAFADGFVIPDHDLYPTPFAETPITVKYHNVNVEIDDQYTKTEIDQVFVNLSDREMSGEYLFPVPSGAVISKFSMVIKGEEIKGQLHDKDEARRIYEDIVSKLRDPALLEYVGDNLFRARVYPIPAKGEVPVITSYSQVLTQKNGVIKYVYPLNTEKFSAGNLDKVSVSVKIESKQPIRSIYSPSHKVVIERKSDHKAIVAYEEENVRPNKDFVLIYTVSSDDFGLSLLTHNPKDENGYFSLLVTPKFEIEEEKVQPKNVIFVLDTSGSMAGDKIVQAKDALEFVINSLNEEDKFILISFADGVNVHNDRLITVNGENRKKALDYIEGLSADGGTNINEALRIALGKFKFSDNPNILIFLTDGQATVGIQGTEEILKNVEVANNRDARMFVFGVGDDVNTHLLDKLADNNGGASEYVREGENIEVAVSDFFKMISYPLLSDVDIKVDGVKTYDVFPKNLPDIFKGSQLLVFGRYEKSGEATIQLTGFVKGKEKEISRKIDFPEIDEDNAFLPQLWAARKIGYLLDTIRLEGENDDLIKEIISISKRFGIITPYTSYLVNPEEDERAAEESLRFLSSAPVSGKGAVDTTVKLKSYKKQSQPLEQAEDEYGGYRVGDVVQQHDLGAFIQNEDKVWVDSSYKEGDATIKIKLFSEEYFELLEEHPEAGKFLSLGKKVIFRIDDKFYEVVE